MTEIALPYVQLESGPKPKCVTISDMGSGQNRHTLPVFAVARSKPMRIGVTVPKNCTCGALRQYRGKSITIIKM